MDEEYASYGCWLQSSGEPGILAPIYEKIGHYVGGDFRMDWSYSKDFVFECKDVLTDEMIKEFFSTGGNEDFFDAFLDAYHAHFSSDGLFDFWGFLDSTWDYSVGYIEDDEFNIWEFFRNYGSDYLDEYGYFDVQGFFSAAYAKKGVYLTDGPNGLYSSGYNGVVPAVWITIEF